jgi:capsular exopolysaccharide synthesis family protein
MKVSKAASYEARLGDVFHKAAEVLRRRKLVLLAVTFLVTAIGVSWVLTMTNYYQGTTLVQIDPSRNPLARSAPDAQTQLASEGIETEVAVINSRDVAVAVVKRLNLENDPEFSKGVDKLHLSPDQKLNVVVGRVSHNLTVERQKLSYVISIKFASRFPIKAAQIANAFAASYLDTKVGGNIGTAAKQAKFFDDQLNQLAEDARAADAKVAAFQGVSGLVKSGNFSAGTITDQQIGPLSVQLASAESVAAEARSKEISARTQVAHGKLDQISDVRTDATIQDLRHQRAMLVQNLNDAESRYGDLYPDLVKAREQIAGIDNQIRLQANRVISGLKSDADAADARAGSLRTAMAQLESKQAGEARASVEAASLQREADSKHQAYDRMAQAALETRQAAQNSIAQAKIIDVAQPAQSPYWPNRPLMFVLSLLVGFGIGIAVIILQEMMVSGLSTVEDIEDKLGLALLATIPAVKNDDRPADLLISKPTSQFSESLRNARASILGVRAESPPKIIALTSALPGEGKTTTALGLGRTMAISGDRTLIFDADVRRAQLRQIIDCSGPGAGTVELLHGEATLDQVIRKTRVENLDCILVSEPYFSSENLFGGDKMHDLLDELSQRYDHVVLDLPPLIGLADARFLAALADAVVLVVRWNSTPAKAVTSAVSFLQADNANLVGSMFTMVDTSSQAMGSYYYYSNKYSSYYQSGS